jgi:hypothetical protein
MSARKRPHAAHVGPGLASSGWKHQHLLSNEHHVRRALDTWRSALWTDRMAPIMDMDTGSSEDTGSDVL